MFNSTTKEKTPAGQQGATDKGKCNNNKPQNQIKTN